MGLAGTKVKQRFGSDPRNTNWANDSSRFGAKHLAKLGWAPGSGLGLVQHATTTHVKVVIKDDNVGLGAKLARKQKKDEFDSGECTGLDVFQRLLGRLNGKEDEVGQELDRQRKDNIINGKWGIAFVKGDVLKSTWDAEKKSLISCHNKEESPERKSKRKSRSDDGEEGKVTKRVKVEKKEKKEKKEKREKKDKKEKKEKKEKTDKADKKDKKDKKEKKEKTDKADKADKKDKKDKKNKKDKKSKKDKAKDKSTVSRDSMLAPKESTPDQPAVISTRLSVRSRWIKQKRAAVMDAKALNEIFMVTN